MPTISSVSYLEQHGSAVVQVGEKGMQISRSYFVDWADRYTFINEVIGTQKADPEFTKIRAKEATIVGNGVSSHNNTTGAIAYEKALINVIFKTNDKDTQNDDTILSQEVDFAANFVTIKRDGFDWADGGDLDQDPGKFMGVFEFGFERKYVPTLDIDLINGVLGKVNNATFYGRDVGHVLFAGVKAKRESKWDGSDGWTMNYKFIGRTESWLKLLKASTGAWTATVPALYESGDFSTLGVGT